MKIQGKIKISANKGKVFIEKPISLEVDKTSGLINLHGKSIQITDCKGTFKSAKYECILVERIEKIEKVIKETEKEIKEEKKIKSKKKKTKKDKEVAND